MNHPKDKDGDFLAKWVESNSLDVDVVGEENKELFYDIKKIVEHVDGFERPQFDATLVYTKIKEEINSSSNSKKQTRTTFITGTIIFLLGLISIGYFFMGKSTTVNTNNKEQIRHSLPDNSTLFINANSVVSYEEDFLQNREVNLKGEAFFEVEKGNPFKVFTPSGMIEVLGTSFNVNSGKDKLIVSCKSGKVKVSIGQKSFILTSGKQVSFYNGKFKEKNNIALNDVKNWNKGVSKFDESSLGSVAESLNQWYGINIEMNSSWQTEEFTGSFVHDDLDKALKMVFLPMGLQTEKENGKIIVVPK